MASTTFITAFSTTLEQEDGMSAAIDASRVTMKDRWWSIRKEWLGLPLDLRCERG